MDEEIESIAARVRLCQEKGPDAAYNHLPGIPGGRYIDDCGDLVSAYLAEHPADDEVLVDAEWFNSTDLRLLEFGDWEIAPGIKIAECMDGKFRVIIGDSSLELEVDTRGDVRRLARTMKIDLKEGQ